MATTQQLHLNLHNIPTTSLPLFLFIFKSFFIVHSPIFPQSQAIYFFEFLVFAFAKHFISLFYVWMSI